MKKTNLKHTLWFCGLIILTAYSQHAAAQSVRFKQVTVSEGLSSNSVRTIYKDFKGFMWFGTLDGLDRFDGVEVRSFSEKFSAKQKKINCIINDSHKGLWVGTTGGLLYWDYISPEFRLIPVSEGETSITTLISLSNDSLLLAASSRSLFLVNTKTFTHTRIRLNNPDLDNIGGIREGLYDGNNLVWLCTTRAILKLNLEDYAIQAFKITTHYPAISNISCCTLYEGNILAGTFLDGIFLFNIEKESFTPYKGVKNNYILSLNYQSGTKQLYVGSDGDGLIVFNTQTGTRQSHIKDNANPFSLNSNAIYAVYIDEENRYWLGTYSGGVNYMIGETDLFDVGIENNGIQLVNQSIRSIYSDNSGNRFFGTRDGLFVLRKDGALDNHNAEHDNFLNSDVILAIKAHRENVLIGTFHGGISNYNLQTKKMGTFHDGPDFQSASFYAIEHDQGGNLWLGGITGLYRIDDKTKKITHYTNENSELKDDRIISALFDSKNRLWIGTIAGTAVYAHDKDTLTYLQTEFNLSDHKTVCFYEDHGGNIWLATEGNGLGNINSDLSLIRWYTTDNGLPSNIIAAITEAPNNIFWISTSKGLSRFNQTGGSFSNYTLSDGLSSLVFNRGAVENEYPATGRIWFGSEKGLLSFYPDSVAEKRGQKRVVLTDFYLSGQIAEPKAGNKPHHPIDELSEIVVKPGQSSFGFRFVALNFKNPDDNKYYHRLRGNDSNWQVTENNQVSFSDIRPGRYTFEVCLSDNIPNDEDLITSILVIVKPKLFQQPAFLGIVLAFLAALFIVGLLFIKRMKKKLSELKNNQLSKSNRSKYESSHLSRERRKEIEEALLSYLKESQIFYNPELKISDLSSALDCSIHHISQVINQNLNQSFNDLINSYRIEAVKSLMEDPASEKYTLYAIAEKCGFKSKTSFYRAFKKTTGLTPLEYQTKIKDPD